MNAAAKVIQQTHVFQGQWTRMSISKQFLLQFILLGLTLSTAIAVINVVNIQRDIYAKLQFAEQRTHQLEFEWGELLLEEASLVTPARVEQLATRVLHMRLPFNKQVLVLHHENEKKG